MRLRCWRRCNRHGGGGAAADGKRALPLLVVLVLVLPLRKKGGGRSAASARGVVVSREARCLVSVIGLMCVCIQHTQLSDLFRQGLWTR